MQSQPFVTDISTHSNVLRRNLNKQILCLILNIGRENGRRAERGKETGLMQKYLHADCNGEFEYEDYNELVSQIYQKYLDYSFQRFYNIRFELFSCEGRTVTV